MKENNIVSRQLAFIVFICMLGAAFIYVPVSAAGRDSWLSILPSALFGLLLLYLLITLQKMFPGVSILQISKQSLGIIPGTFLNVIYLCTLFLITTFYLYDIAQFMSLLLPYTSEVVIRSLIILVAVYILYQGVTTMGRLGDFFGFLILLLAIIALAIPGSSIIWSNFLPLLNDWRPIAAGFFIAANWPFGEIILFALFLPLVTDLKDNCRTIYCWYGIGSAIMLARIIVVMGILGPETTQFIRYPLYHVLRSIALAGFQRIEMLFFFLWFLAGFAAVNLFLAGVVIGANEIFKLKNTKMLILPIALLTIVICTYMNPSDIGFPKEELTALFLTLPVYILYPTIIFIAARLRTKAVSGNSPCPGELNNR